jgi:hypothetical protein
MGAVKFAHKRIFVYTTYSPPIEGASETLPVSFKCVSVDKVERRFSVFDETVSWESIGKGCLGAIFPGPTGDTYVAMLNRKKLKRAITTFIICSHNYTGNVSLNFVLAETAFHSGIYRKHPTNEVVRLLNEIVVPVEPHRVTTIPYLFPAKKSDFLFNPREPIVLTPDLTPSVYETVIANAISPGRPCVRRLMQPLHTDGNLLEMADLCGVPNPSAVNLVFGAETIKHDKYSSELWVAIQLYNGYGQMVGSIETCQMSMFKKRQAAGGRVRVEDERAFAMSGLALLDREFFRDSSNVRVEIGRLPPDVCSISFVMFDRWKHDRPHEFKRPFVRVIDSQSQKELTLFSFRLEESERDDAILVGGLYFANDLWMFAPVAEKFKVKGDFRKASEVVAPLWVAQLSKRRVFEM